MCQLEQNLKDTAEGIAYCENHPDTVLDLSCGYCSVVVLEALTDPRTVPAVALITTGGPRIKLFWNGTSVWLTGSIGWSDVIEHTPGGEVQDRLRQWCEYWMEL